jgi:RsiW-degrading membrane proteinase PrsW (M82 family)
MENLIYYLIERVNWQNSLIFVLLSGGPTLIWLWLCLSFDRSAPEPKIEIFKIFLWGCLITLPLIPLAGYLSRLIKGLDWLGPVAFIFILSFLIDGLIEEISKYLVLRYRIYQSKHFDELRDGFVYGMTLGLGFAFMENIFYGFLSATTALGATTVFLRGFTSTFMHFLSGGIIGYYLGLYKFKNKKNFIFQGIFWAVLFHGLYNTIVRFNWWWNLLPLAILLLGVYLIIFKRMKKFD